MGIKKRIGKKKKLSVKPDRETLLKVQAGFKLQDTSLHAYCIQINQHRGNAEKALLKTWDGKKARILRSRLIQASKQKPSKTTIQPSS